MKKINSVNSYSMQKFAHSEDFHLGLIFFYFAVNKLITDIPDCKYDIWGSGSSRQIFLFSSYFMLTKKVTERELPSYLFSVFKMITHFITSKSFSRKFTMPIKTANANTTYNKRLNLFKM